MGGALVNEYIVLVFNEQCTESWSRLSWYYCQLLLLDFSKGSTIGILVILNV